jgi:crossover junction endodeoxyribonuclease RuvC
VRILGVDPGSRVLGYAVIESRPGRGLLGELRYVECGVIQAKETDSLEQRLGEIATGLREVIEELRPSVVAAEDVFFSKNARSALALGQARGAALAIAGMAGLRVFAYPPAMVKQAVTGQGRAAKTQVGQMIRVLLGLKRDPRPDAADALAVAVAHAQIRRDLKVRVA